MVHEVGFPVAFGRVQPVVGAPARDSEVPAGLGDVAARLRVLGHSSYRSFPDGFCVIHTTSRDEED